MTKRLIEAAEAALGSIVYTHRRAELHAALDEARQPVTVTPDQAVEILAVMLSAFGEPISQEDTVGVATAILQKARELGL